MALTKKQKEKVVDDLKDKLTKQKVMVLIGVTGLKMKDISELRKKLKSLDANLKVSKKTLLEIVFKENKLDFDKDKYKEELGIIFGFNDQISSVKTAYQFSKENENLKILGGFLDGRLMDSEEVINLAQLPSREELLAKLVGGILAPISNLAYLLNYNIKGLVTVLAKAKI